MRLGGGRSLLDVPLCVMEYEKERAGGRRAERCNEGLDVFRKRFEWFLDRLAESKVLEPLLVSRYKTLAGYTHTSRLSMIYLLYSPEVSALRLYQRREKRKKRLTFRVLAISFTVQCPSSTSPNFPSLHLTKL